MHHIRCLNQNVNCLSSYFAYHQSFWHPGQSPAPWWWHRRRVLGDHNAADVRGPVRSCGGVGRTSTFWQPYPFQGKRYHWPRSLGWNLKPLLMFYRVAHFSDKHCSHVFSLNSTITCSLWCLCLCQSTSMSTTSVSQLPGYFSSLCTGHAPFLPFKPSGKPLSRDFSLFHKYTYWTVSLHVIYKMRALWLHSSL